MKTVAVRGFPSQTFAEIKTAETAMAVMEGADEIDVSCLSVIFFPVSMKK